MQAGLLVLHVLLAAGLIGLVLVQHGRGADAGAAFGSGASGTVFGARGATSFLTKITTFLAIGFFANSLALAYLSANQPTSGSLMERVRVEEPANPTTTISLDPSGSGDAAVADEQKVVVEQQSDEAGTDTSASTDVPESAESP